MRGERVPDKAQDSKTDIEDKYTSLDDDKPKDSTDGLSEEIKRQITVVAAILSVAAVLYIIACILLGVTVRRIKKR